MPRHIPKTFISAIRLLFTLIFILEQAACSKPTQPIVQPQPTSGEENVVITFTDYESSRSLYEPVMAEFHKQNPSITVQFVALPESSSGSAATTSDYYRTQAAAADTSLAFGGGPDVSGYFRDLQPQIDADPTFKPDDFWPRALTGCQDAQGHTWGVPMTLYLTGIYYDEQAFEAAGLPTPKPGWTWDEFRQDATALAKQSGDAIRYGYADMPTGNSNSILTPLLDASLAANGGEIDPQALAKVAQWYLDLAKAKVLYPITGMDYTQQVDDQWKALFATVENRPAMWAGSLIYPVPGKDVGTTYAISEYGFAPFPVAADGSNSNTTPLVTRCAVISANSLHPAATWAWINFLSRQWLVQDPTKLNALAQMPARRSVAEAGGFWTNLPAKAEPAVRYGLTHGCYLGVFLPIEQAIDTALGKAAFGQIDLAGALAETKAMLAFAPQSTNDNTPVAVATPKPTQNTSANVALIKFYNPYADPYKNASTAFEKIVEQFNKSHSDIVIEESAVFPSYHGEGYYTALANNYDCFISQNDPLGASTSDQVLSLDSMMAGEDTTFKRDYDSLLLQAYQYQGELYDLPLMTQPNVIYYNTDLLVKRGLQPPSTDWTVADFVTLIQAAASTSETDRSFGFINPDYDLLLADRNIPMWLDFSSSLPIVKLDTPEMSNALAWLTSLVKSGALYFDPSPKVIGSQEAIQKAEEAKWIRLSSAFESGQIAFWESIAGETDGGYASTPNFQPPFKIGVLPFPVKPEGNGQYGYSRDVGIYISRQAKNPNACWTWMKFLSEQPTVFDGIPARKSVAASPTWEAKVGPDAAVVYRLAADRVRRVSDYNNNWVKAPLQDWEGQAIEAAFRGNDPSQALKESQQMADAYLTCLQTVDPTKLSMTDIQNKVNSCAKQADPQGNWGP